MRQMIKTELICLMVQCIILSELLKLIILMHRFQYKSK